MERKRKTGKGEILAAVCCLAVVMGVVGFAGRRNKGKDEEQTKITQHTETNVEDKDNKSVSYTETVKKEEKKESKKEIKEEKAEKQEPAVFLRPVSGKVIEEFTGEDLIYNEALKDWRTHDGVDFEANLGEQIISSCNGVVEDITDSNMGKSVIIDHKNGFKTIYSNLAENVLIKIGDEVAGGDVIGNVGETALGDATEVPHLHFEMTKNGESINPIDFLE